MKTNTTKNDILFITSFPGRECGIATYSKDLIDNLHNQFGDSFNIKICALEEGQPEREYCQEIWAQFDTTNYDAYTELAGRINTSDDIKLVVIQHEFGLFGGKNGNWLIHLLEQLNKPVVTSFHTVLPDPDTERLQLVKRIAAYSQHLIVMTHRSAGILEEHYNIARDKITIIPHGTHIMPWKGKDEMKSKYNVRDRLVLSTFGLISRNKGIETALDAMAGIKEHFPNVLYLVLGKTHPGVVKHEGESYRESLLAKVEQLNLSAHVKFINKYLDLNELLEYLKITDIYLFTSLDPHQAVSGTFSYAMGSACPVISTPIPHAREMINDGNGLIVDFRNPEQLRDAAIRLLADPELRENMGKNAFHFMNKTIWNNVVIPHARIFENSYNKENTPALRFRMPDISLNQIQKLTTKTGIIQFSKLSEPDIESGYTLDDNSRALIALSMYFAQKKEPSVLPLLNTYLSFIEFCQQPDGSFLNYVNKHKKFSAENENINLDDANGRALWALGKFLSYSDIMPNDMVERAASCLHNYHEHIPQLQSPRAVAFAIKGLYHISRDLKNNEKTFAIIDLLATRLLDQFNGNSDKDWKWFEEYCTYANSILPEAMLYAFQLTGKDEYLTTAIVSFDFLLSHLFTDGKIKVVSNQSWLKKGEQPNLYGEQPIDVAYTILALDLFYKTLGNEKYKFMMENAFSWFLGNNHLERIMYNSVLGGCYDGLEKDYINLNMGAESNLSYLMARLTMEQNLKNQSRQHYHNQIHKNKFQATTETFVYKSNLNQGRPEIDYNAGLRINQ